MGKQTLAGKTICITGASGGLGRELAFCLASEQTELILIARRTNELEQLQKRLRQLTTYPVHIFSVDLTNRSERAMLVEQLNDFKIDVFINNAGYGVFKDALDFEQGEVENMFELNVFALIELSQAVARQMVKYKNGTIVQIASQAGKTATNKTSVYAATKFAVIGYSNALRLELKPHGIHVMTVNPGPIATEFFAKAEPSGNYLKALGNHVLAAETVAQKIVSGMQHKKREVNLPWYMNSGSKLYTLFPHVGDYLTQTLFNKK